MRRVEGAARLAGLVWARPGVDALDAFVDGPERAVQIAGSAGWGKTTHLRSLRTHLEECRRISVDFAYLAEGETRLRPLSESADVWLVDEAQRLSATAQKSLFQRVARSGRRLIFTSHENLSGRARAAGLSCRCVALGPSDADHLAAFVQRRLELATVSATDALRIELSSGAMAAVQAYADGNLARAEDALYFLFQTEVLDRPPDRLVVDEAFVERAVRRIPPEATGHASA